ncbi:hypothetical protein [Cystobacter ferrugineus]|nr:hypothetical protein [Cystobacter ferrugineus]
MPNDTPSPSLLVDDSLWPLLIVQLRGVVSLAHLEEYLVRRLTYLRRQEKHVVLFDMRHTPMLPSEVRQRHSEWLKQHAALIETRVLGHALVVTSPLLRLMLSTFHKVRPRNGRHLVTPHLNDAARWCLGVLEESGGNPPTQRIEAHFCLTPH